MESQPARGKRARSRSKRGVMQTLLCVMKHSLWLEADPPGEAPQHAELPTGHLQGEHRERLGRGTAENERGIGSVELRAMTRAHEAKRLPPPARDVAAGVRTHGRVGTIPSVAREAAFDDRPAGSSRITST